MIYIHYTGNARVQKYVNVPTDIRNQPVNVELDTQNIIIINPEYNLSLTQMKNYIWNAPHWAQYIITIIVLIMYLIP